MKDIKAVRGKYFLEKAIAEGEHERQDFKYAVNDARKIARSLSAFANHSGGRLLIGVKDNGVVAGVRNEEDIYVVEAAAELYCDPSPRVDFSACRDGAGAVVIVAEVEPARERPVRVKEGEGRLKAYYRVADQNIVASGLMVKAWRSRASRSSLCFDAMTDGIVLEAVRRSGPVSVNDLCVGCGMSRRAVELAVTRLFAMDLVAFEHVGAEFLLTRTSL